MTLSQCSEHQASPRELALNVSVSLFNLLEYTDHSVSPVNNACKGYPSEARHVALNCCTTMVKMCQGQVFNAVN